MIAQVFLFLSLSFAAYSEDCLSRITEATCTKNELEWGSANGLWNTLQSASYNSSTDTIHLTDAVRWMGGAAVLSQTIPLAQTKNMTITFSYYMGGGNGADGISVFLADANIWDRSSLGSLGGNLGYTNLHGGYIGVGFDTWGNFLGVKDNTETAIGIRGCEAGQYQAIKNFEAGSGTQYRNQWYYVRLILQPSQTDKYTIYVTLQQASSASGSYTTIFDNLKITQAVAVPAYMNLGVAATTGDAMDVHEVRGLRVVIDSEPLTVCQWCPNSTCISSTDICVIPCDYIYNEKDCLASQCLWNNGACSKAICGNGQIEGNEECDASAWCNSSCLCSDGSASAANDTCQCPNLDTVSPTVLKNPPVLTTSLAGTHGDQVVVGLELAQMLPYRWNVVAEFVSPVNNSKTGVKITMVEHPCLFKGAATFDLQYLISNAKPYVVTETSRYRFLFNVDLKWLELFELNGHQLQRVTEDAVAFEIIVWRDLTLGNPADAITVLNSTLLWAYIEKARVTVPVNRSNPYMDFQLVTSAVESGYKIDPTTFVVSQFLGNVVAVTTPTFVEDMSFDMQRWSLRATLAGGSVCSTTYADNFTLQYTIVTTAAKSASHTSTLRVSLGGLENWCALNSTISFTGVQTTYASASDTSSTLRFFLGDVVHVRDHIDTDLSLSNSSLVSASLSGAAIISGNPIALSSGLHGFALEPCPTTDGSWVCYSFVLDSATFNTDKSLIITSVVRGTIQDARRGARTEQTQTATFTSALSLGASQEAAGAGAVLLPAVAATAFALAVLIWRSSN